VLEERKAIADEKVKGTFLAYIVHAQDIPIGDTSKKITKAFVEVFFPVKKNKYKT